MTTLCVADLGSLEPFDRILSHREQLNEHSRRLKMVTISVNDRLLAAYLFYGGILLLKMLSMSLITAFYRIKNKVCDIIVFTSTEKMDDLLSTIPAPRS